MSRFLIGQVCNALGVKPHVLRYWERNVELLSPAKDRSGRRVYTLRDVQLLFRLKYLVHTRKMTVEGASRKLTEEAQGKAQNRKGAIDALRGSLLGASIGAQRLARRLESAESSAGHADTPVTTPLLEQVLEALPAGGRLSLQEQLDELSRGRSAELTEFLRRQATEPAEPRGEHPLRRARRGEYMEDRDPDDVGPGGDPGPDAAESRPRADRNPGPDAADSGSGPGPALGPRPGPDSGPALPPELSDRPLHVVTPACEHGGDAETYPGLLPLLGLRGRTVLDRAGGALSTHARRTARAPLWTILVSAPVVGAVRRHLRARGYYGLGPDRIRVLAEPQLPLLTEAGEVVIDTRGSVPTYELPLLSALHEAARAERGRAEDERLSAPFAATVVLPATNALPRVPDEEFLSRHLEAGAMLSLKTFALDGKDAWAGEAVLARGAASELLADLVVSWESVPVMRFSLQDDILDDEYPQAVGRRARLSAEALISASRASLVFEIDAETELAFLRSVADWESCSQRVRDHHE